MSCLGCQLPHNIRNLSRDSKRVYPHLVCLSESVSVYNQAVYLVNNNPQISLLVSRYYLQTQELIANGIDLRWNYLVNTYDSQRLNVIISGMNAIDNENKHLEFIKNLQATVYLFYDKVSSVCETFSKIEFQIKALKDCYFEQKTLSNYITKIQNYVNKLSFGGYSNLKTWTKTINIMIQNIFLDKLKYAVVSWILVFNSITCEQIHEERHSFPEAIKLFKLDNNVLKHFVKMIKINKLTHEIVIRNQIMHLDPMLEASKKSFIKNFHNWICTICSLPKLISSDLDDQSQFKTQLPKTEIINHHDLLELIEDEWALAVYSTIDNKIDLVREYVELWLQYQSLWDLEHERVYAILGDDLTKWENILLEIKKSRSTFDTSQQNKNFGVINVNFESVQSKVNSKYDMWQKDILKEFGGKLASRISMFHNEIKKYRHKLENFSIQHNSATEMIDFIAFVQDIKKRSSKWKTDVELYVNGQKILELQRFQFPEGWIYSEQLISEWSSFNEILTRKDNIIQEHIEDLQIKISKQDEILVQKAREAIEDWDKNKPLQGDLKYDLALNAINNYENKLSKLKQQLEQTIKAKEALGLQTKQNNKLDVCLEELSDIKAVWLFLSNIWQSLNEHYETSWALVVPRKIRSALDLLLKEMKGSNIAMKQYFAFSFLQEKIKDLLKSNTIIIDLKSEAIKERHWKKLFKKIGKKPTNFEMTLGDIWDLDLAKNIKTIQEVVETAQGELALEEFIKQLEDTWSNYTLDLINYQNRCRLIKGWDELLAQISEHLSSLNAMKLSPYYKQFQEQAQNWEEKISKIQYLFFDIWIDIQRQWVYLEGIFTDNIDIKQLLPMESSRFQNINVEFMTVMKKVYKSPYILDVINIPNITKSLERIRELLGKIQKALGEYLERERSSFPRFYFVGDQDLLEIVGNSKDIVKVQSNFKKMFSGIGSVMIDKVDESNIIKGIFSKEGESVIFKSPLVIDKKTRINQWLRNFEAQIKSTLCLLLKESVEMLSAFFDIQSLDLEKLMLWINSYPDQILMLTVQIIWTQKTEEILIAHSTDLQQQVGFMDLLLKNLSSTILEDLEFITRKKCEHLITEIVYQKDTTEKMIIEKVNSIHDFLWNSKMRYYLRETEDTERMVLVSIVDSNFYYGFEYVGVVDKLVQTELTDKCFLNLTQAMNVKLGGSPFGPAGTGKTESVKALGAQLGRFVLVFCCDENFDFQAMGRIFVGLCQVGAWGCFDEFNRLEENILSSISQQIQSIQEAMKLRDIKKVSSDDASLLTTVSILGNSVKISPDTGIFITMNPGYAGRSNLPDNLKKLFRSISMTVPNKKKIAQVMLYSQGFVCAEELAHKIVPLFDICLEQLSSQTHYDFGLRALKSVLVSAGSFKRTSNLQNSSDNLELFMEEQKLLIKSLNETVAPKLVQEDLELFENILKDTFIEIPQLKENQTNFINTLEIKSQQMFLCSSEKWTKKVLELYNMQKISHGIMLVGESGTGKSCAWKVLLSVIESIESIENVSYVIDPKAMSKEDLYGHLDYTTREWTDGLFTYIIRKIQDSIRGEIHKRHWIIFDGDVDPEWVENLNSVLDDNKLLTLPNGERLSIPENVRILFEVENLKYATMATVSRCGMIWFSKEIVSYEMLNQNYFMRLLNIEVNNDSEDGTFEKTKNPLVTKTQVLCTEIIKKYFEKSSLIEKALEFARKNIKHIMEFTDYRALNTLFSLLKKSIRDILTYNIENIDFQIQEDILTLYLEKKMVLSLVWSLAGDSGLLDRITFCNYVTELITISLPSFSENESLFDYDVSIDNGQWFRWSNRVPELDIETHLVSEANIVIPTIETLVHEEILDALLAEHKPLILCGPPGSGKTMTLLSALRKLDDLDVVSLNFSSETSIDLLLKTFEQYCEYKKINNEYILSPLSIGKWIVLFCDEINLPKEDKYGTQSVMFFIRQLIEQGGFWRSKDKVWVRLERIQFVGACNPPTDAGRVVLSNRFLRHTPLIFVGYPGKNSLFQIYNTFNRSILKLTPELKGYSDALTASMIDFYFETKTKFSSEEQAHYIYSPRELTRWVRGIYESIKPLESENISLEYLLKTWAHEALRLFQDRLVTLEEKTWTENLLKNVCKDNFPSVDVEKELNSPILFSNWLSKNYVPTNKEELKDYIEARMKVFCEEELDVKLVLFDSVIDHVLRIDRVFRQVQGHMLLIGISGSGKTTMSRFVAWINGLSVYQIKAHNKYTSSDFDEDLRTVLRRAGCKGEKICFILDESNVLESGFLERMNTLLANSEIPGLFEGDEHVTLMTQCKEAAQKQGLILDSEEELYKWFMQQISTNLHIVFTMNPPRKGFSDRSATSPALFNRCVLDWVGDWSTQAFYQVAKELTGKLDIDQHDYVNKNNDNYNEVTEYPSTYREAIINSFVYIHKSIYELNTKIEAIHKKYFYNTPRHYLDLIKYFVDIYQEKRRDIEEEQKHLNMGLKKLHETVKEVEDLKSSLSSKSIELQTKNNEASSKLSKMVQDQQSAEKNKEESIKIQEQIIIKNTQISDRKKIVMSELANAEPAVIEAQKSVKNIKKQHLTEVRSMANPPLPVKIAMESVCILLGHKIDTWKSVQGILRRDDFIPSIENFDTKLKLTKAIREKIKKDYMNNTSYNFDTVNRASKACGPLVKWVIAQVSYSSILDKVGPLRKEVESLENSAKETVEFSEKINNTITEIEIRINTYKEEYAILISEVQSLKTEMEKVKTKVERSIQLLENLSNEKDRWQLSSQTFDSQIKNLAGDALMSSAFMAYCGQYDQFNRKRLLKQWKKHISDLGISYKKQASITDHLITQDQLLIWKDSGLPNDDLCVENAIMINRFNRFPLVIDPSGQAIKFIENCNLDKKLVITSFLDDSINKNLESALRFGNSIIIQDVDRIDPIINPILNMELRKTGGRVLIRLGTQDIDYSPTFRLVLYTRDSTVSFPPDVCSRVTMINFTMTNESLTNQCLNAILKHEAPEIENKRTDISKLQGEYNIRLRHLEKTLLKSLSQSQGNILDDDSIIKSLENLQKESKTITDKVQEMEKVMEEINETVCDYTPLSQTCSRIFFVLESLSYVNHFYHFSLAYFNTIFQKTLRTVSCGAETDVKTRLENIKKSLFVEVYTQTSVSMLNKDRPLFIVLLIKTYLNKTPQEINDEYFNFLCNNLKPVLGESTQNQLKSLDFLDEKSYKDLIALSQLTGMQDILENVSCKLEEWKVFMNHNTTCSFELVPYTKNESEPPLVNMIKKVLLIKCIKPHQVIEYLFLLFESLFENFTTIFEFDLETCLKSSVVVSSDNGVVCPLVLCSDHGYDPGLKLESIDFGQREKHVVAMGSKESHVYADKAIYKASLSNGMVILKNAHLSLNWLSQLEKRLHKTTQTTNQPFNLYIITEMNKNFPVGLITTSKVLMFESTNGLLPSIQNLLKPISKNNIRPVEKSRLYFLLAFLHSVVQERSRYVPLGWSKNYEFNDSDFNYGLTIINGAVEKVSKGRSNISPEMIPFENIKQLLKQCVYGSKVDDLNDNIVVSCLVDKIFTSHCFDSTYSITDNLSVEEINNFSQCVELRQFLEWGEKVKDLESPNNIGLPSDVNQILKINNYSYTSKQLRVLHNISNNNNQLLENDVYDNPEDSFSNEKSNTQKIKEFIDNSLKILPKVTKLKLKSCDPLQVFFMRENRKAFEIHNLVRQDLRAALENLINKRFTNHSNYIIQNIRNGTVPEKWKNYFTSESMVSISEWVVELNRKISNHLEIIHCLTKNESIVVELGALFQPKAYITATRQFVSERKKIPLEMLNLKTSFYDLDSQDPHQNITPNNFSSNSDSDIVFYIKNINIFGANMYKSDKNSTNLDSVEPGNNVLTNKLKMGSLSWSQAGKDDPSEDINTIKLPVYLNRDRNSTLFMAKLKSKNGISVVQHGVAFII